jgi:hypothetical protein
MKIWRGFFSIMISFSVASCGTIVPPGAFEQKWSENYASTEGVKCTAPEMTDGNIYTVGKFVFPGGTPDAEVEIILPEKKSLYKIVIYNRDLRDFTILASMGAGDNWQIIKKVDNNKEEKVIIRTSVTADKLKIRARGNRGERLSAMPGSRLFELVSPEIKEIELYGYIDTVNQPVENTHTPGRFARGDDRRTKAQTGIGTWFSRNDDDPMGISFKGWAGENGVELRVAAFGVFSELNSFNYEESAFGLISDYRVLYRYSSRVHEIPYVDDTFLDNSVLIGRLFYPYLSLGLKGGFITGKAYSESITIWIYGIEAMGGFATDLAPFEVSLDLLGFGYIGLSIEDMGRASGFYRVGPSISIHYYF